MVCDPLVSRGTRCRVKFIHCCEKILLCFKLLYETAVLFSYGKTVVTFRLGFIMKGIVP